MERPYRSIPRIILIAAGICAGILSLPAWADYFNDSLLNRKTEELLRQRRREIDVGGRTLTVTPPDTLGIEDPRAFGKPLVSESDSVDYANNLVKMKRNIVGLRSEPFSYIPLDQYISENLTRRFRMEWNNPKKRLDLWSTQDTEKKGGVTDLDFVLPGSGALERFAGVGETRINIDGRQKITFSGRSEWTEGQIETSVSKNSAFPSLTMKQEPQFRINGTVAGRIHVDIQQDPQSGQFSNVEDNIKINYQGEEDEIIKYIEAGSTSLSLEGATFAGYQSQHKGLFGIRSEAQLGPLKLNAIASQEKSEANVKSFRGSAEESTYKIRDYEYKANTYFFIDFLYREKFETTRDSFDRIIVDSADSLVAIEIYEDDSNIGNNLNEGTFALRGEAFPMNRLMETSNPELSVDGYYHRLDPAQDSYVDRSLGFIQFTRRVPDESTIGVYMRTKDGTEYGNLDYDPNNPDSKITLKLIKRKKQLPTNTKTWDLEWKNVYDLGQRDIEPEGLEIRIYRDATDGPPKDTQDGIPFINILGLDKSDELGNLGPDNKVDLNRGFVNFYRGELIFPLLEPFDPAGIDLKEKIPSIYKSQNREEKEETSRYYIEVQTANRQRTINIGAGFMGVMEGTEKVLLDGKPLVRGSDYRINYQTGTIEILNEEALSPSADLEIRFEEPNALQAMQKTLLGVRGEMDIFSESKIGSVVLFKNESTSDQRVKLGQEPSRMLLFDSDAQLNFKSKLLTSALDKLPLLVASDPTTVRIEGEIARSMPNMNTKGVVYIDDFEGSQNTPMSIVRTNWTRASLPDSILSDYTPLKSGTLNWYNPWDRVPSRDIWPNKETSAGDNTVHVLNLDYTKNENVPSDESFAGVQQAFYGSGIDLSRSRFIEIWLRGGQGELKVDLGSISEDYYNKANPIADYGDGYLNTEDKPIPGQGHGDGVLTKEEDTGLDGLFDSQERASTGSDAADPSGDNFKYSSDNKNDYSHINGTEGNASDGDRLGVPDTEDINRNGILDTRNAYYEYTISLERPDDIYLVPNTAPEGDPAGWRLYRIPLWNNINALKGGLGAPDSTLIEYARLWVTDTDAAHIQIASIEIVENSWLEQGIVGDNLVLNDKVRVTNANTHENQNYSPPPGVKAEIDRQTKIRKKEQSLVLKIEDLQPGNTGYIYRTFENMNFTDYTSLNMFVHGPEEFPLAESGESDVELIIRFGGDRQNYYEYRTQIFRGWADKNEVKIDFERCSSLKLDPGYRPFLSNPDSLTAPADTVGTKIYTIKGSPSLDYIKTISIGVQNNRTGRNLTADIWVDELRMDSLRDMTGTAARINTTLNMAGILNVSSNLSRTSPDFHDMNSKTGSGQQNTNWGSNVTFNADRLTPRRWNLKIPVSVNGTGTEALPRLMSGSDIVLNDDQKDGYKTTSSSRKYRVSFNKGRDQTQEGITGVLVHWAFEKVNASYDFGERSNNSPFSGDSMGDTQQLKVTYDVDPTEKAFKPFLWLPNLPWNAWEKFADMDVAYTPNQMSYNFTLDERNQYKTNISGVSDTTQTKSAVESYDFGYSPFKALRYTYTLSRSNDMIQDHEVDFSENNMLALNMPTVFHLQSNYSYSASYAEQDNPKYNITAGLGTKNINMVKVFTANATFGLDDFIEDLSGKPKPPTQRYRRSNYSEDIAVDTDDAAVDALKPREPAPKIDEETKPPDEEAQKKGPGVQRLVLEKLSGYVSPLNLEYRKNNMFRFMGVEDRPGFSTRFTAGSIDQPDTTTVVTRQNAETANETYSARTKFSFPLDIGVSATSKLDRKNSISSSANTSSESATPVQLSLNWTRLETRLPFIEKVVSNLSVNSSYSMSNSTDYRNDVKASEKRVFALSPLFSLSGKMLNQVNTSFSINNTVNEGDDYSGNNTSHSQATTSGTSLSLQYNISASRGILFLKNLLLKSDIALSMSFSTQHSESKRGIGDDPISLINSTDSWSLSPNVEYKFSQKFRGGANMRFNNSVNMTKKVHKVREVSMWCELVF